MREILKDAVSIASEANCRSDAEEINFYRDS
jgi:hypothetical protein